VFDPPVRVRWVTMGAITEGEGGGGDRPTPRGGRVCVYTGRLSYSMCAVCVIAWVAWVAWVPTLSACGCVLELWLSRLLASLGRVKLGATYCHEGIAICVGRSTVRGSG